MNTGILMFINNTISQTEWGLFGDYDWLVFTLLLLVSLFTNRSFQVYLIKLTNEILYKFELDILLKIRNASMTDFEQLGKEKAWTAMQDTRVLGSVPMVVINTFNSLIIIVCCVGYLFWISPIGGIVLLVIMALLFAVYLLRNKKIKKELDDLRDLKNVYTRNIIDLLDGFRELKMSIRRNENLYDGHIVKNRKRAKDISINTSRKYLDNTLLGSYSWYLIIGVVIFVLPVLAGLSVMQTSAFIITVLYMMGPVADLVNLIPFVTSVKIATERLDSFENELNAEISERYEMEGKDPFDVPLDKIRLNDIQFAYKNEEGETTFELGPIDFEVNSGEIVFITGGNGSGKSTLASILVGLKEPQKGSIYFNDVVVEATNYAYFRNRITTIFSKHYLFTTNYDEHDLKQSNAFLKELIEHMKLTPTVKWDSGELIQTNKLSDGQKKRMAMILALLEKKDIILMDEWAAEQDPIFRKYFYLEFLQILKKMGKTIIAVSHDEHFFGCADRLIELSNGKIEHNPKLNAPNQIKK